MNVSDRGQKHVCPDCETKFYDLKRKVVACPKCGAKPKPVKLARSTRASAKTGQPAVRRYP